MSSPTAFPSAESVASRPAPTAPPAGPESTLQAPARAASAAGATPPDDLITSGSGRPRSARGLGEPPQVAAEQGRQVGVDDGGRAALVLAKLRQHLVRGRDVEARELGAQALGDRALVRGVEVGEQQADGHRLGVAGPREGRHPIQLSLRERLDHALGAGALPGREAELVGHQRGRLRRAEPIEVGAVLASDLEQVGEALGGDQGRARAALLEQGIGAHGHAVGERLDLVRAGARPLQRRLDRGEHPPRLVVRGGRRLRRVQGAPVEEHGVGERPADVDSEQHGRS